MGSLCVAPDQAIVQQGKFCRVTMWTRLSLLWVGLVVVGAQKVQFQREVENPLNCVQSEQSRNGDTISVTYKGFLADGTVFDTNEGKEPISFVLGEGRVIKGWERGLLKTCPGEKVIMIIPSDLGYGSKGAGGGVIPGGATLYFIATLEAVTRKTQDAPQKDNEGKRLRDNGKCKDLKLIKKGDKVTMTSKVSLLSENRNGNIVPGKTIDASTDTIKVGDKQVIKGWDDGVVGACEGEERRIVVGPNLAWGEKGLNGIVPEGATVVIDVKIDRVERDLVFNFLDQISSGTFRRGG